MAISTAACGSPKQAPASTEASTQMQISTTLRLL